STTNAADMLLRDFAFPDDRLYTVIDSINTERFRPFDGSAGWEAERRRLRAELGIPENRRIVVYLGLLAPYQGTNILLEAARQPRVPGRDRHLRRARQRGRSGGEAAARARSTCLGRRPGRAWARARRARAVLGARRAADRVDLRDGA